MKIANGRGWMVGLSGAVVFGLSSLPVRADDFALSVSPPRFELQTSPGKTVRAVAELTNASSIASQLFFATAEWELTPDGGVITSPVLRPNSCRPWVAIERRKTVLQPKTQLRYRFEVSPPADATPTECRFALVISSADQHVSPSEGVSLPVNAQIALIVYVTVGDVKPKLEIVKADVVTVAGVRTPALMVRNAGQAHGRLSAFLTGTDAKGIKREFSPSTLPILPGETRLIALNIDQGGDAVEAQPRPSSTPVTKPTEIAYPLRMSGTINDSVSSFKFDGVFEP